MTQEEGACAESDKQENGLKVKADRDFGAIEVAMCVNGRQLGFFLTVDEAEDISEALLAAVKEMEGANCPIEEKEEDEADEDNDEESKA